MPLPKSGMESVILFDGVCNFCNASVNFIIHHDSARRFRFAALQSDFGRQMQDRYPDLPVGLSSIVLLEGNRRYVKSEAVLRIARHLDRWSWLYAGRWIPVAIRDWLYNLMARNRYRILGKRSTCRIPTADERRLFLH